MALVAVELKNVTVRFEGEIVLQNVSVKINEGQKVVLIGPSGQGKSTLLKVMAGLVIPDEGQVFIRSENLHQIPARKKQELLNQMGMLFQKNALFDSLSVGQNIAFPLKEVLHQNQADVDKAVDFFLNAVGISHAKDLFPDEISGGMQKRLGIARALAMNPQIIFYDDPTAGLDPITSRKIIDLILDLQRKNNATVIAVTNDMNRAHQLADQIVMVVDKGVLLTGNKEETEKHPDPRVHQFIHGLLQGPLTVMS